MYWYYLINGLVFFGVPLSFESNQRLRRHIQMLFFPSLLFILTIFVGLRLSSLNADYDNYSAWFDSVASGKLVAEGFANDPAFVLVSYLVSALGLGIISVIVIFAAAALASQFYFSKIASEQKWAALLFYLIFCRTFAGSDMSAIRAAVAVPLLSSSILLAFRGRRKIALLMYIAALAFHVSTLIGLLPFILAMLNVRLNSRWWILSFAPATLLARLLLQELILFMSNTSRTSAYAIGLMVGTDPPKAYVAYIAVRIILLALMTILLWNRITSESRLVLFCFTFAIMIQIVFISNNAVSWRGSDVFGLFDLVALMIPLKFLKGSFCFLYAVGLVVLELALFQFSLKDLQPYHWIIA
jgi:hypothetical protein